MKTRLNAITGVSVILAHALMACAVQKLLEVLRTANNIWDVKHRLSASQPP
jgi:hypothetical protein